MKTIIVARKMDLTEGIKSHVEKKIKKLDKFFKDDANANVTLSTQKDNQKAELTITYEGMLYRAEVVTLDLYKSIDKVVDLLERQIRKQKTKLEKRLKTGAFVAESDTEAIEEEKEFNIVKTKTYETKPMSPSEAILQMNLLGHGFYIFEDSQNGGTSVVYKRNDGDYGLIEIK